VFTGAEISPYYDPMIAKLICYGVTRRQAMRRMARALAEYHILGVTANTPFHQNILQDERFIAGNFDTRFVEEQFSLDQGPAAPDANTEAAAILATLVKHQRTQRSARIERDCGEIGSAWKRSARWKDVGR
jgi:acetyl/propionyl-CoA carboxylase alpha subunit